jgi:DNA polymerase-3 subunit alpha
MAKERENFGFYFSAHPVQQFWQLASANGARSYQSLMEGGTPPGGRASAVMAAMVEGYSKGKTRRGADFARVDFSDSSGQFSAACFEDSLVPQFDQWSKDGTCLLLNVELDAPNLGDAPRVTVRGARPLSEVKGSTRMQLTLEVLSAEALRDLELELSSSEDGQGEVVICLPLESGEEVQLRLGSNFMLDGELAERLAAVEGLRRVSLQPLRARPNLRLVA